MGGQRVTVDYDANGWPTAVTHWPGVGDEAVAGGSTTTEGATPEIAQWVMARKLPMHKPPAPCAPS